MQTYVVTIQIVNRKSYIAHRIVQFPMTLSDRLSYFAYCMLLNAFLARRCTIFCCLPLTVDLLATFKFLNVACCRHRPIATYQRKELAAQNCHRLL